MSDEPKGWRLVPVDPTEEMLVATCKADGTPRILEFTTPDERDKPFLMARFSYRAMLSAAPLPPENAPPLSSTDVADNGPAPVASEEVERVESRAPATVSARKPALSLTTPARAVSREEVAKWFYDREPAVTWRTLKGKTTNHAVEWQDANAAQREDAYSDADALLALIGGGE